MTHKRPIRIDRQASADHETEQAILRVQRTLCLMNAPHSYRLYDAAALLRQAARSPDLGENGDRASAGTAAEAETDSVPAAGPRITGRA